MTSFCSNSPLQKGTPGAPPASQTRSPFYTGSTNLHERRVYYHVTLFVEQLQFSLSNEYRQQPCRERSLFLLQDSLIKVLGFALQLLGGGHLVNSAKYRECLSRLTPPTCKTRNCSVNVPYSGSKSRLHLLAHLRCRGHEKTMRCGRRNTSAVQSGETEADTTAAEAASKRRCIA